LYSWIRFTWQSNTVCGSTTWPVVPFSQLAKTAFWRSLALRTDCRKAESSASGLSRESSSRSVTHFEPMASEIAADSAGFASRSQRRGVTPFVLLLKRSGKSSARSLTVLVRRRSEWMAATPFVLCEPTMARFAMRIFRSGPSSTRLTRATRAASPGYRARTSSRSLRLISKTISRCRGRMSSNQARGHFSSASGSRVWFV